MRDECTKCIPKSSADRTKDPDCANCKKNSPTQLLPFGDQK